MKAIDPYGPLDGLRDRLTHFYFNKYILPLWDDRRYHISYSFRYKALWYRVYKVGTRSIDQHFREHGDGGGYIYASAMPYRPQRYADWFRFAFVRHPVDRLVSAWRNKVLESNYFGFPADQLRHMRQLEGFVGWLEGLDVERCDEHLRAQHVSIDMDHVQFIGRFERFEEDMHQVADRIGLSLGRVHHRNRTGGGEEALDPRLAARIAQVYAVDMKHFYPEASPVPGG